MKVRNEIEQHSAPEDKPVLLWLLERYHWESQFTFVAKCTFKRYGRLSYESHRIWAPTPEGRILYNASHQMDDSKRLDQLSKWAEDGCVTSCIELEGGIHLTLEPMGGEPRAARNKTHIREAIDELMAVERKEGQLEAG